EACASDHRPASHGEILPSGETPVASCMTSAAPPIARLPRCTRCQSVGNPSTLEYWHIGETKTRFLKVSSRRVRGEKRWVIWADFREGFIRCTKYCPLRREIR